MPANNEAGSRAGGKAQVDWPMGEARDPQSPRHICELAAHGDSSDKGKDGSPANEAMTPRVCLVLLCLHLQAGPGVRLSLCAWKAT